MDSPKAPDSMALRCSESTTSLDDEAVLNRFYLPPMTQGEASALISNGSFRLYYRTLEPDEKMPNELPLRMIYKDSTGVCYHIPLVKDEEDDTWLIDGSCLVFDSLEALCWQYTRWKLTNPLNQTRHEAFPVWKNEYQRYRI